MPDAPWIVAWEGEMRFEVRDCPYADGKPALWQPSAPGTGKPLFERLHIVRSRRAIWEWLCPICGEPTDPDDRFWFGLGRTDILRADGSAWPFATLNAPYHRHCAETAAEACPHLSHRALNPMRFPRPDAVFAAHLTQVGPSMQGLDLQPGQAVVSNLFLAWREKPKGAM